MPARVPMAFRDVSLDVIVTIKVKSSSFLKMRCGIFKPKHHLRISLTRRVVWRLLFFYQQHPVFLGEPNQHPANLALQMGQPASVKMHMG